MKAPLFSVALLAGAVVAASALAQTPPPGGPPGPPPMLAWSMPQAQGAGTLQVMSSTLVGGAFPMENTGYGASISPALSWSAGPAGTRSYVLITEDADAGRNGTPILHWLAYNIPASSTSLPAGLQPMPAGMMQGANIRGAQAYAGPRPPAGGQPHHYHFQVYAVDKVLDLQPGADRAAVLAAMQGHVLARGETVGVATPPATAPAG